MAKKKETVIKSKTLGEQEASQEKINRAIKTDERVNAIADSYSYKTYMKEYKNYHGWQNAEPMDTEPDVRYEFDKENYLKEFHGKHLAPIEDFREIDLLEILIDSVKTALHPSHKRYREYLTNLLSNNNLSEFPKLTLRQVALYAHFNNEKITVGNQDDFSGRHGVTNKGKKLYKDHFALIKSDEKNIYQHKQSKTDLEAMLLYFTDEAVKKNIEKNIKSYSRWIENNKV